jgi:ribonuclease VapC
VEAAVVVDSARDPVATRRFDELICRDRNRGGSDHGAIARQAYRDFGRGTGSPARLNFGDCFAYALAAQSREPLLFKGDGFTHTDLVAAELPGP